MSLGAVCEWLRSLVCPPRLADNGDALDRVNRPALTLPITTPQAAVPVTPALPPIVPSRPSFESSPTITRRPTEVFQVGVDRDEDYKAAREAAKELETTPSWKKKEAWAKVKAAWAAAAAPKVVQDDQKISDLLATTKPGWFSFEFYPPKSEDGVTNLKNRILRMKNLGPLFVDFTWGAGGSTSELTLRLTSEAKNKLGCVSNMHLTCTNQHFSMVDEALAGCKAVGVRNIVALRGDAPRGQEKWTVTEGGFACALDLIAFIREKYGDYFSISVAGYPEGHPDAIVEVPPGETLTASENRRKRVVKNSHGKEIITVCRDSAYKKEMQYLKAKVDAGADFIITQMFLDTQVYLDFVETCRQWGITVPIVPGIMMLNTLGGLVRMSNLCKTRWPPGLLQKAEAASSEEAFKAFGIDFATDLCRQLLDAGAPGLHFYTLNLEKVVLGTLQGLGLVTPEQVQRASAGEEDARTMVSAQGITTGTPQAKNSVNV